MNKENKEKNQMENIRRERTPGEIVVARRKQLDWSQEELEWRSGVSTAHLYRIENDKVKPGIKVIEKLEKVLDIQLRDVVEEYWEDRPRPEPGKPRRSGAFMNFARELFERNPTEEELQRVIDRVMTELDREMDMGIDQGTGPDAGDKPDETSSKT